MESFDYVWASHDVIETLLAQLRTRGAHPEGVAALNLLAGQVSLAGRDYAEAEARLREYLARSRRSDGAAWLDGYARLLLGSALVGQKRFADAEPQLLAGSAGVAAAPMQTRRLALWKVGEIYEFAGRSDMADAWKAKYGSHPKRPVTNPR